MASTLTTTISSTAYIQGAGPVQILDSTSASASLWYPVNPYVRNISFQAIMTGSSAGAAVTGAFEIQASNDGQTRIDTLLGTISVSGFSPGSDGLAIDSHWKYIRAVVSSGTTQSSGTAVSVLAASHLVR